MSFSCTDDPIAPHFVATNSNNSVHVETQIYKWLGTKEAILRITSSGIVRETASSAATIPEGSWFSALTYMAFFSNISRKKETLKVMKWFWLSVSVPEFTDRGTITLHNDTQQQHIHKNRLCSSRWACACGGALQNYCRAWEFELFGLLSLLELRKQKARTSCHSRRRRHSHYDRQIAKTALKEQELSLSTAIVKKATQKLVCNSRMKEWCWRIQRFSLFDFARGAEPKSVAKKDQEHRPRTRHKQYISS